MANLLWGQVYFHDRYAGILRQEPGERFSFTYEKEYLERGENAIAWTLPLQDTPHLSEVGLHPFFDNLVAEGWLQGAQTRLLGKRHASRMELLLSFGKDCAGAVSIHDPTTVSVDASKLDPHDPREMALLRGKASLSGIQPKFTLVQEKGKFRAARANETSTHIAKFSSAAHRDLVENEFLSMQTFASLLPDDEVASVKIAKVEGIDEPALIVERFDRLPDGSRQHFEEFNQLLGNISSAKYDGTYRSMAAFISTTPGCVPAETFRLYLRVLAGLLVGNTDMHLKNFAMLHTPQGLRLTPSYDQVAAALYDYRTVALEIAGARELLLSDLKARHVVRLGEEFGLAPAAIMMAYELLAKQKTNAMQRVAEAKAGSAKLKESLIQLMEKRWNGTFNSIGQLLSKKRSNGGKSKV